MEHNGDVYSCDHFVFPEYLQGNIAAHTLADLLDTPAQDAFGLDKRDGLPGDCQRCTFKRFCHGGCPAHRLRRDSHGEPGMNVLCEGYLAIYRHSLPTFEAMATCLRHRLPASQYPRFLATNPAPARRPGQPPPRVGRNDPCPCGSGRKAKHCCQP